MYDFKRSASKEYEVGNVFVWKGSLESNEEKGCYYEWSLCDCLAIGMVGICGCCCCCFLMIS